MRYFKVLNKDGAVAAFGKNDTIGEEITEEAYNALYAAHCPPNDRAAEADYLAALEKLGVTQ